jgi:mono/diheme cytochrome c family protein
MHSTNPTSLTLVVLLRSLVLSMALAGTFGLAPRLRAAPQPTHEKDAMKLYNTHCKACHGKDGRGLDLRAALPSIPDFTSAPWQADRTDADINRKIVEGHEPDMPAFKEKLAKDDQEVLTAFVRSFAAKAKKADSVRAAAFATDGNLAKLYRESGCVKCHGKDGKGTDAKPAMPSIPDFANASWQKARSDAQLSASILDGKGTLMPPFRERLKAEHVKGLVAYLRQLGPGSTPVEEQTRSVDLDEKFRALEEEFEALKKQHEELRSKPKKP